jgi:hypothetical protein
MSQINLNRRQFLSHSAKGATAGILATSTFPYITSADEKSPNERLQFAAIGVGGRGAGIANSARRLADIVAVCDLDTQRIDRVNKSLAQGKAKGYQDLPERFSIVKILIL